MVLMICGNAQIKVQLDIPRRELLKYFQQMSLVIENIKTHSWYTYLFGF